MEHFFCIVDGDWGCQVFVFCCILENMETVFQLIKVLVSVVVSRVVINVGDWGDGTPP